jgi:hypothetical protein
MVDKKAHLKRRMEGYLRQHRSLMSQVSKIGFIWSGSISKRMITCGNSMCACHEDPKARHGPYIYWTTKKEGKTVARLLKENEAALCMEWVENRKRLDQIIRKCMKLSQKVFNTQLRLREHERKKR